MFISTHLAVLKISIYPLISCVNYQISKIMHNIYESTNYALISGLWLSPFHLDIMNRPENSLTHVMFQALLIKKTPQMILNVLHNEIYKHSLRNFESMKSSNIFLKLYLKCSYLVHFTLVHCKRSKLKLKVCISFTCTYVKSKILALKITWRLEN